MAITYKPNITFTEDKNSPYKYKEFMEAETPGLDGAITTDDLTYLMPEVINREIITIAEDVRVGRNLIDVIRINSASESFLKEYGFTAEVVEEGAEIPLAKVRHEKIFLTTFKTGVRPLLTYEAMADGKIPILQRNIRQASLAMARAEDAHIMTVLNAGVPNGATNEIYGTNEDIHTFTATDNELTWDLLVQCYTAIYRENLTPTDIVIHPYQMNQFLKMKEFRVDSTGLQNFSIWNDITSTRYGSGRIGSILGCNIWITNNQPAGKLLMLDRNNYGILAERQPLLVESDTDIVHQLYTVAFSQRYAAGILNNDGAAMITDLETSNS